MIQAQPITQRLPRAEDSAGAPSISPLKLLVAQPIVNTLECPPKKSSRVGAAAVSPRVPINLAKTIRPAGSSRGRVITEATERPVYFPASNPDRFNYRNHAINYSNYRGPLGLPAFESKYISIDAPATLRLHFRRRAARIQIPAPARRAEIFPRRSARRIGRPGSRPRPSGRPVTLYCRRCSRRKRVSDAGRDPHYFFSPVATAGP